MALQKTYAHNLFGPPCTLMYRRTAPHAKKNNAVRRQDRAPLLPLPVISVPFQRMAMDIVGPLEKSSAPIHPGHQRLCNEVS